MVGRAGWACGWKLSTSGLVSKAVGVDGGRTGGRTLGDDRAHNAQLPEPCDGSVSWVWPRLAHVGPAQEAPGPVPLAHLVVLAELIVVDGPVRLVQGVGALGPAVVGQARGDADACAGEQQGGRALTMQWPGQEVDESSDSARGSAGARRDDARRR